MYHGYCLLCGPGQSCNYSKSCQKNIHIVHVTFLSTFLITELFIRLVFEQFMKPTKNIIISAERTRVIHIDNSNSVDTQVNSQYTYCMCIQ